MSEVIIITVPGIPVAKGRPRFSMRGGFARAYTPAKTIDAEDVIASYAHAQIQHPLEGAISLNIEFYMPIPMADLKRGMEGMFHVKRPDVDNLAKLVLDGMKDAWHDDSQIADIHAVKLYGKEPRTVIHIRKLEK